jgi:stringent starvation protein B
MTTGDHRMSSYRPYLVRALYQWILDNEMTPHLLVDAARPGVRVPPSAVQNGRVVLNIAPRAVSALDLDNDVIAFSARFGGVSQRVEVPVPAVLAIYARESGHGMALPDEANAEADEAAEGIDIAAGAVESSASEPGPDDSGGGRRNHLRVVK